MIGYLSFAAFMATIPLANWLIGNVGTCVQNGPCLIPVGFGLMAPSGAAVIGLALVLRDVVHRVLGWQAAIAAIIGGAALSAFLAPPALVVASAAAFLLSEVADFAVYAPLQRKRLIAAVLASGVAGAIVDSAVFLSLAFGSLEYLPGQVVGKLWATIAAAAILWTYREGQPAPPDSAGG
jgi:queuosine precursor transporter